MMMRSMSIMRLPIVDQMREMMDVRKGMKMTMTITRPDCHTHSHGYRFFEGFVTGF